jgi:predicted ATPase
MNGRFVILSGCSGGGKSTLLEALRRRGHAVVDEPGRRIVRHEIATGGTSLPWLNMEAFARRAIEVSLANLGMASINEGWVFFDRGLVDAAAALEHATSEPTIARLCKEYRYHVNVFSYRPGQSFSRSILSVTMGWMMPLLNMRDLSAPIGCSIIGLWYFPL